MRLPRSLQRLTDSFQRLPGIGPKTASRLAFYLLRVPQEYLDEFSQSLSELKKKTVTCSVCFNVAEKDPCVICSDRERDKSIICVVEEALDVLALERADHFNGVYHVLHGAISPLNNIGPEELFMAPLFKRLKDDQVKEVILATNPNLEGEATAMYIQKKIQLMSEAKKLHTKVTRIGLGLPTGADLEYADDLTLNRALEGRRVF
ncbi:recombination mediator RecR [Patescibacteria group bacterium]|nr:recombination mediator RecR [Patescibacteria group bacterium]